jgi:hypothetical protein
MIVAPITIHGHTVVGTKRRRSVIMRDIIFSCLKNAYINLRRITLVVLQEAESSQNQECYTRQLNPGQEAKGKK